MKRCLDKPFSTEPGETTGLQGNLTPSSSPTPRGVPASQHTQRPLTVRDPTTQLLLPPEPLLRVADRGRTEALRRLSRRPSAGPGQRQAEAGVQSRTPLSTEAGPEGPKSPGTSRDQLSRPPRFPVARGRQLSMKPGSAEAAASLPPLSFPHW